MSPQPLFMEERRRSILETLRQRGRISVMELSELLGVSAVTIRQDLRALERDQLLERTHGGAVLPISRAPAPELSFEVRLREYKAAKNLLAQAAFSRVQAGDSIALDSSTTVFALLPLLRRLDRLIIVTNSLMVAQHCLDSPQIQVYMPGGRLRRDSISLVGKPEELPDINLTMGFFSAHGISPETGITESSQEEVQMKRALMQHCLVKYCLVDGRKWGKIAPYTLAHPAEFDALLTTADAPPDPIAFLREQHIQVEIVGSAAAE